MKIKNLWCLFVSFILLLSIPTAYAEDVEAIVPTKIDDEVVEPDETMEPEILPEPEETIEPEILPEPEETMEPDTLPEPEETIEPDALPEPEEIIEPDALPEPEEIIEPEILPEPEETMEPDALPEPERTVIRVIVPDSGQIIVNPYRLDITMEGSETREQIVSGTYTLANQSDIPVMVHAYAVGTVPEGSGAVFVSAPPLSDTADTEVFVYTEFQEYPNSWYGDFTDAPNQILVTKFGESKNDVLALEPWGEGYFRLFGAASTAPVPMWTTDDVIHVTLAFTFSPIPLETDNIL